MGGGLDEDEIDDADLRLPDMAALVADVNAAGEDASRNQRAQWYLEQAEPERNQLLPPGDSDVTSQLPPGGTLAPQHAKPASTPRLVVEQPQPPAPFRSAKPKEPTPP